MKTIRINNIDYSMKSPTSEEYKNLYIESLGDKKINNNSNPAKVLKLKHFSLPL